MSFYPDAYERKEAPSDYLKITEGDHRIRILMEPIIGFETWDEEGGKRKPYRAKTYQEGVNLPSKDGKVKEFHAFIVWDYETSMVRLLNVTQKSIQEWIYNQTLESDWSDPTQYDIVIKRKGKGLDDTKYFCTAKVPKPLDPAIKTALGEVVIDSEEYFKGGHPIVRKKDDSNQPSSVEYSSHSIENSDSIISEPETKSVDDIADDMPF